MGVLRGLRVHLRCLLVFMAATTSVCDRFTYLPSLMVHPTSVRLQSIFARAIQVGARVVNRLTCEVSLAAVECVDPR